LMTAVQDKAISQQRGAVVGEPPPSDKVAVTEDGGTIPVWGDGSAIRAYTYMDDMVEGIYLLMHSDFEGPVNIGASEYVTVDELVATVIEVSGKKIHVQHVEGPVGMQARNSSKARIKSLGGEARVSPKEGIEYTYPWIKAQVRAASKTE